MLRPAPIQVAWFNMFATSGLSAFDYLIGDEHVIPARGRGLLFRTGGTGPRELPDVRGGLSCARSCSSPLPGAGRSDLRLSGASVQDHAGGRGGVVEDPQRASRPPRCILKNVILGEPAARDFVRGLFARFSVPADRLVLEGPAEHYHLPGAVCGNRRRAGHVPLQRWNDDDGGTLAGRAGV